MQYHQGSTALALPYATVLLLHHTKGAVMQSYWQSAVAAKPSSTYAGYILGGLCWFSIPFTLATSLGLASRALDLPISKEEAGAGELSPPAVALLCHHIQTCDFQEIATSFLFHGVSIHLLHASWECSLTCTLHQCNSTAAVHTHRQPLMFHL
jgi:hypothetical protein